VHGATHGVGEFFWDRWDLTGFTVPFADKRRGSLKAHKCHGGKKGQP